MEILPKRWHSATQSTLSAADQQSKAKIPTGKPGNDSRIIPPINLAKPVAPLRWHEAIHSDPELYRALCKGWSGPTPRRLAQLHRQRLGRPPYGGWPGQPFLYAATDVAQLAQLVAADHRAMFRRGVAL